MPLIDKERVVERKLSPQFLFAHESEMYFLASFPYVSAKMRKNACVRTSFGRVDEVRLMFKARNLCVCRIKLTHNRF